MLTTLLNALKRWVNTNYCQWITCNSIDSKRDRKKVMKMNYSKVCVESSFIQRFSASLTVPCTFRLAYIYSCCCRPNDARKRWHYIKYFHWKVFSFEFQIMTINDTTLRIRIAKKLSKSQTNSISYFILFAKKVERDGRQIDVDFIGFTFCWDS